MSNLNETIAKSEILDTIEQRNEDFDVGVANATKSFHEKLQKAEEEYPEPRNSTNARVYKKLILSIENDFRAELFDLIKTKKISYGIMEFFVKNCDPFIWKGMDFLTYVRERMPNFALTCCHVNKKDGSFELDLKFFQR